MSAEILPTEILEKIFSNLDVRSLVSCREVCTRWRDIVDGSIECWKSLCDERHSATLDVRYARSKASISYREFYRSLTLWPKLASADVIIRQSPIQVFKYDFEIIAEGVIGCPMYGDMNAIVYYDLNTYKEIGRLFVGFYIAHYVERTNMVVLVDIVLHVYIILKSNMQRIPIGALSSEEDDICHKMIVLENEIFYVNSEKQLCRSELVKEGGEIIVKNRRICPFRAKILAAVRINSKEVNFLVPGGIICLTNDRLETHCKMSRSDLKTINIKLEEHGFKWSQPEVFEHLYNLRRPIGEIPKNIIMYKSSNIYAHGDIVLVATYHKLIHIFKTFKYPEKRAGFNKISYRAKLLKSLDLKKMFKGPTDTVAEFERRIDQMQVVETATGHKILVAYGGVICCIEFYHKLIKNSKRPASTCACSASTSSPSKKNKTKKNQS